MPALRHHGGPLVAVVASKSGYPVYPFSSDVVEAVLPDVPGFDSTKGGIRFTLDSPLPEAEARN